MPEYLKDINFYMSLVTPDHFSYDQIPDLTGKVALVTGANQGIGYATTLGLVAHGARVVMACRSQERAQEAIEQLHKDVLEQYPKSVVAGELCVDHGRRLPLDFLSLDLNNLKSVHQAVQEFLSRGLPLHILINNSGVGGVSWGLSEDGIENHFAINHLGHFVLTTGLLDRMKESQPARIVVVSALLYDDLPGGVFDLSKINDESVGDPLKRYARSKMANILFANALQRRLLNDRIYVNSLHPGVVDTGMAHNFHNHMSDILSQVMRRVSKFMLVTKDQGALTQLYLATSPEVENMNIRGRFFIPVAKELALNTKAQDVMIQEELWKFSEDVAKEKIGSK
ncbi:Retinol dehydrogenase 14, partial [Podila humilis]